MTKISAIIIPRPVEITLIHGTASHKPIPEASRDPTALIPSQKAYDLQNEDDAAEVARLYGNQAAWELSGNSYESAEPRPF